MMMNSKMLKGCLVFATLVLNFIWIPSAIAEVERVYGKAYNLDGELEYVEEHVVTYENGSIAAIETTYYDAASQKIAGQVFDFTQGSQFGSYDFRDERHRYNDGVRVMPDQILIYCKENPKSDTKRKYLPRNSDQIVGQGFYQYVASNLEALARGDSISAKLVLPAQMGQYDVRIYKNRIQGNRIQLVVELDNWFLRLFAPNIEVEFDLNSRRLLWYRGISMVSNKDNKNIEIVTTYDYPQQSSLLAYSGL
jgi:hypothetical protein